MKTSELIKLLKKSKMCYFVESGKEHDKWHSNITGKDFAYPGIRAKSFQPELRTRYLRMQGSSDSANVRGG